MVIRCILKLNLRGSECRIWNGIGSKAGPLKFCGSECFQNLVEVGGLVWLYGIGQIREHKSLSWFSQIKH